MLPSLTPEMLETTFPLTSANVSDAVRMWFGRGSDVVRTWFGRGSDVVRTWFGRVFSSGADRLAEVEGKWFPAPGDGLTFSEKSPRPSKKMGRSFFTYG